MMVTCGAWRACGSIVFFEDLLQGCLLEAACKREPQPIREKAGSKKVQKT